LVKSTPGSLDEDEELVADEEEVADLEAIGVAAWSICNSEMGTSFPS